MIFTYTQPLDCEYNRCWKLSIELVQSIKTTATWVAIAREALLSSIHLQSACPATGTFTHRHTHRHRETQSHTQTTELTRMHGCMTLSTGNRQMLLVDYGIVWNPRHFVQIGPTPTTVPERKRSQWGLVEYDTGVTIIHSFILYYAIRQQKT